MKRPVSSLRLPCNNTDDEEMIPTTTTGAYNDGTSTCDEGWYLLITGAAPN